MLGNMCRNCKRKARYGLHKASFRGKNVFETIICTCNEQFADARNGEFIFCRFDGTRILVSERDN